MSSKIIMRQKCITAIMSTWAWACNKYMTGHCDKGK